MAAIPLTYSVTFSHVIPRRADNNISNVCAPLQRLRCRYRADCCTNRRPPNLSWPPNNVKVRKPNMRSCSIKDGDSPMKAQPMIDNGSVDASINPRTVASLLDKSTKWVLLSMFLCLMVWKHRSPEALWAATGCILNNASSRPLKKLINQPRPARAFGIKTDPGMPSTHAQNLGYYTAYTLCTLIGWQGLNTFTLGVAFAMSTWAICTAWLRILQGVHTYSQVIIGALIGSIGAFLWFCICKYMVLTMLISSKRVQLFIITNFIFIFVGFVIQCKDLF